MVCMTNPSSSAPIHSSSMSHEELDWSFAAAAAGWQHFILILKIDSQPVWDPFWDPCSEMNLEPVSASGPKSKNIFKIWKPCCSKAVVCTGRNAKLAHSHTHTGESSQLLVCLDDVERKKIFFLITFLKTLFSFWRTEDNLLSHRAGRSLYLP